MLRHFEGTDTYIRTWTCVMIGDAAMAPYELTAGGGAIDLFGHENRAGLHWLTQLAERLPRRAWLNPEPERYWNIPSTALIRTRFEMFPLTLDGLDRAVGHLRRVRV